MTTATATNNTPAQVTSIKVQRAEGLISECYSLTLRSFAEADAILSAWRNTAPENGAYHKCDFFVTWENGDEYQGTYYLQRGACESLAAQIRRGLARFASKGEGMPAFYASRITDEQAADAARMLRELSI